MSQLLDFEESIILPPRGDDKLQDEPVTSGRKERSNKTPGYRRLPNFQDSPEALNVQRDPETSKEEAEEIARLQLMLIQKKLHLAQLSRSAAREVESQRSLPKSRSPQRSRGSLSQSPKRSLEKSAVSQNRSARDGPVAPRPEEYSGERGKPLKWETLDI